MPNDVAVIDVVAAPDDESFFEGLIIDVVGTVTTGSCAAVSAFNAALELRPDFRAERVNRTKQLVAMRRAKVRS